MSIINSYFHIYNIICQTIFAAIPVQNSSSSSPSFRLRPPIEESGSERCLARGQRLEIDQESRLKKRLKTLGIQQILDHDSAY